MSAAPEAEAGDQYSLMLRMTPRMERLGNEVSSLRDEMLTFFIISMNTGEAEARADTAAAAAKEETDISMARAEIGQETAQKLGLQNKKIEDLLQKLQAVGYNCANTNAAQGATRADAAPLPQLHGATMIKKHEAEEANSADQQSSSWEWEQRVRMKDTDQARVGLL